MKSAAIIYARANSARFPQKCLAPMGKNRLPLVHWIIFRAAALNIDYLVFATTNEATDDELVASVKTLGIPNFRIIRGSTSNLIQRTLDCLHDVKVEHFVRINGDSPFFPVVEINEALTIIKEKPHIKFISNLKRRTYPYGVALEVINADFYIKNSSVALQEELEHTTLHLYRVASDQITQINNLTVQRPVALAIDTKEDFNRLNGLIQNRGLDYTSNWSSAL